MKLTKNELWRAAGIAARSIRMGLLLAMGVLALVAGRVAKAEGMSTTTVQGTVYLANGQPGSGTLRVSWPGFSTAGGQLIVADSTTVAVGPDGFISVNLAPNQGATPAGLYYTAVFYMSDGSVNTQYWVVPAAAQASLAQVQAQVMPAAQAVQAVSKAYVDQSIAQLGQSELTASGGTLTGPLFLSGDPTQPTQAADKHYVDSAVGSINTGSGTVGAGNSGQIAYYTANGTAIGGINAVPVTAGGTGATTALSALQSLGGISSTSTSLQTMAGPLSANVNGVDSVVVFGAKGDCNGNGSIASCTDNYAAIQAAVDAAYASGGAVLFPSSPSASGQTVYYTSRPINPKGVSMYGPEGASGPAIGNNWQAFVAVRGAPGKDVFDVPDATTSGWVTPHGSFVVKHLSILVDDSVDVSASFANRRPGRPCNDVTANGTTAITSSAQCEFQLGDVGQAITVGSTTTTITGVSSMSSSGYYTQATLGTTIPTGTNLSTYISVMGLPVTQTIGNCGFAYDAKDFTAPGWAAPNKAEFEEVNVNAVSGNPNSGKHQCGFFFQGPMGPYMTRWEHDSVQAQFGYVFVPSNSVAPSSSQQAGIGDYNVWDNVWISSPYPFLAYDGGFGHIQDMQVSLTHQGIQLLSAYGITPWPSNWTFHIPELESNSACTSNDVTFRISGFQQFAEQLTGTYCSSGVANSEWDASESELHFFPSNAGALTLAGSRNKVTVLQTNQLFEPNLVIKGVGNQVTTCSAFPYINNLGGIASGRCGYGVGSGGGAVGDPRVSRGALAFNRTHDFIDKGATNYFLNSEDLFITPDEMGNSSGAAYAPNVIDDSTSDTGRAIQIPTSGYWVYLDVINSAQLVIGKQIPAGKVRFYVKAKTDSGTPTNWGFALANGGTSYGLCGGIATTSIYTVYPCDADLSAYNGQHLAVVLYTNTGGVIDIAWTAIRPYDTDTLSTSLKLGAGSPMNGNHGTGSYVQHSDGTGASGNLVAFNADGGVTNGPAAPSGAIVGTTDAQSLTNKSIAGSEINSGTVGPAFGGTGQNESSATGVGQWSSGTYLVSNALANGTTATTQTAGDNSIKVATTAYVASPGAITPTAVTASGLVTGGNDATRTTAATIGTTSFTTTGLVLPAVPASSTRVGRCLVYWQMSSTSYSATFGIGMSNAPTGLWGGTSVTYAAGGTSNWLAFSQTATAATAVSTAATAGSASTTYRAEIDFTLQTGATNPATLTLYGEVSNASATLTIGPGSACYWLP